jgi:hypothetical protein
MKYCVILEWYVEKDLENESLGYDYDCDNEVVVDYFQLEEESKNDFLWQLIHVSNATFTDKEFVDNYLIPDIVEYIKGLNIDKKEDAYDAIFINFHLDNVLNEDQLNELEKLFNKETKSVNTIQDLIDTLNQIEDKSLPIKINYYEDGGVNGGYLEYSDIEINFQTNEIDIYKN